MGFDTRRSIEIELEYAKESGDTEYIRQCKYAIVEWELRKKFDLFSTDEMSDLNTNLNGLEAEGACWQFAKWCEDQNLDDMKDAYDNLSCDRGGRFDCLENYEIADGIYVGAALVWGTVVYAEIWYDDTAIAAIRI